MYIFVLILQLQHVSGFRRRILYIIGDGPGRQAAEISTMVGVMRTASHHHRQPSPQPGPCQPQPFQPDF